VEEGREIGREHEREKGRKRKEEERGRKRRKEAGGNRKRTRRRGGGEEEEEEKEIRQEEDQEEGGVEGGEVVRCRRGNGYFVLRVDLERFCTAQGEHILYLGQLSKVL